MHQETEARVAGIKEEMHTEMTKDNKKAAEDQTKNLELQRAQVENAPEPSRTLQTPLKRSKKFHKNAPKYAPNPSSKLQHPLERS